MKATTSTAAGKRQYLYLAGSTSRESPSTITSRPSSEKIAIKPHLMPVMVVEAWP